MQPEYLLSPEFVEFSKKIIDLQHDLQIKTENAKSQYQIFHDEKEELLKQKSIVEARLVEIEQIEIERYRSFQEERSQIFRIAKDLEKEFLETAQDHQEDLGESD